MNPSLRTFWIFLFWFSLAGTIYTYFFYPLLLVLIGRIKASRRRQFSLTCSDRYLPRVTMIVCAYNEEKNLPAKIQNCRNIDYPAEKLSFLFGSDGSDDKTWTILQSIQDPRFRVVEGRHRRGKVGMLNALTRIVHSDLIVFSDANTMYESTAIRRLVEPFSDPKVGCVIGKQILFAPDHDPLACKTEGVYWRYENWIKEKESLLGAVAGVNGSIFAIRRHLYEKMPRQTITEDQVLGLKIMSKGYKGIFEHRAIGWEPLSTLADELRRRIRISAGNFQSLFLVPRVLSPLSGWIHFAFVSHKLIRWLVPFFLLAMLSANVILAGQPFYGSVLFFQSLFYGLALLGMILPKLTGVLKILSIPKYFLAKNVAILLGFGRFITRRQRVTWFKASRRTVA